MAQHVSAKTVQLGPALDGLENQFVDFCRMLVKNTSSLFVEDNLDYLDLVRKGLVTESTTTDAELKLHFAESVVLDFVAQNWRPSVSDNGDIRISLPTSGEHQSKEFVKQSHLRGRNVQLSDRSVQEFVRGMERPRLFGKDWCSIFSLMRDGEDLAERLRDLESYDGEDRHIALKKLISPYIQFAESGEVCKFTGLRLTDIWRYFRHTWTNEYKSVPGRLVMILIRDAAAPNHPVIGIAALGSSVVQHKIRDAWIGWQSEAFIDTFLNRPQKKTVRWLLESVERLIADIYKDDLGELCSTHDIEHPTSQVVRRLFDESENSIVRHRENPQRQQHKKQKSLEYDQSFFEGEAKSFLFRSKRCKQLAKLLSIRIIFQKSGFDTCATAELPELLKLSSLRDSIGQLVRMIKAEHVGIDMMDITVCGAVAPYGPILGGKLVCMLLCSPEVVGYYNRRYSAQYSVIASAMKGSPVIRKPSLVLLCTTSLYGSGSSQYNRVKIPLREVGMPSSEAIQYENLGHSTGYGTYQFSSDTVRIAEILNARKNGPRVNSIFGEGVNPLMRKIREALGIIGLDSDQLMNHGNRRVTYGIGLASNFREVLMGINSRPKYLLSLKNARKQSDRIVDYWIRRWLSSRVSKMEVVNAVASHKLTFPISHGAKVPLPENDT